MKTVFFTFTFCLISLNAYSSVKLGEFTGTAKVKSRVEGRRSSQYDCPVSVNLNVTDNELDYYYSNLCNQTNDTTFSLEVKEGDLFLTSFNGDKQHAWVGQKVGVLSRGLYKINFSWIKEQTIQWSKVSTRTCRKADETLKLKRSLSYEFSLKGAELKFKRLFAKDNINRSDFKKCPSKPTKTFESQLELNALLEK